jgi:catechol 2,3-dioxygenase-like lactoylglutathione lyase family enzyme
MSADISLEIDAIDHIVLRTAQREKMLSFYINVLNCSLERETSPELGLTQLRAGTSLIDIVAVDSQLGRMGGAAPAEGGRNLDHFCLRLKSISEADLRQYLQAKGIDVGEFAERYGAEGQGLSIYLEDPDGNTVELRSQL